MIHQILTRYAQSLALGISTVTLALASLVTQAGVASAVPTLQLNVTGGIYLGGSEESGTNLTNQFSLNAYCKAGKSGADCTGKDFFLSVALLDQNFNKVTTLPTTGIGSFSLGGTVYNSSNFSYGKPAELSPHGVFDTFFTALNLGAFSASSTTANVDVEPNPANNPLLAGAGKLFFKSLGVDISNLSSNYRLHFDLYGDGAVNPYSHDVVSSVGGGFNAPSSPSAPAGGNTGAVPEPMTLVGTGLAASLGAFFKKRRQQRLGLSQGEV